MQDRPLIEPVNDDPLEPAKQWVGNNLQSVASRLGVKMSGWNWQTDDTTSNTNECQLVVVGSHGRRVIKLFTAEELRRCANDIELQSDILARLTQLVSFLRDGRSARAGKNLGRKRCDK
jgi:hypothetical protein